jgi:hypothetical protein
MDFAGGQIAWGVTSGLLIFVSHLIIVFFRVILRIVSVAQLSVVLHAGALLSCHNFRSLCLSYRKWSRPGSSLFSSESVNLVVDSLYAEAREAVKVLAAFSASVVSMWIPGEISSLVRLRTASSLCALQ